MGCEEGERESDKGKELRGVAMDCGGVLTAPMKVQRRGNLLGRGWVGGANLGGWSAATAAGEIESLLD